jgi:hypothetical protein
MPVPMIPGLMSHPWPEGCACPKNGFQPPKGYWIFAVPLVSFHTATERFVLSAKKYTIIFVQREN